MPTPLGPAAAGITDGALRVGVEIDVSEIAGRLEREALRLINDYSQRGLTGDALADAVSEGLRSLSPAPVGRAARGATSESFNLGRNLEAQKHITGYGAITSVIRSEILDENTCPPCRELDGTVVAFNSPEYFEKMPPNLCDGHELCRGIYLFEAAA